MAAMIVRTGPLWIRGTAGRFYLSRACPLQQR